MSTEEGDLWRSIKEESKNKRWDNVKKSITLLKEKKISVIPLNEGQAHYRVMGGFDFWPTTGKFYNPKTKQKGRGVFNLIKTINKICKI